MDVGDAWARYVEHRERRSRIGACGRELEQFAAALYGATLVPLISSLLRRERPDPTLAALREIADGAAMLLGPDSDYREPQHPVEHRLDRFAPGLEISEAQRQSLADDGRLGLADLRRFAFLWRRRFDDRGTLEQLAGTNERHTEAYELLAFPGVCADIEERHRAAMLAGLRWRIAFGRYTAMFAARGGLPDSRLLGGIIATFQAASAFLIVATKVGTVARSAIDYPHPDVFATWRSLSGVDEWAAEQRFPAERLAAFAPMLELESGS